MQNSVIPVKWTYRHFDKMLIVQTKDSSILFIYCPESCLFSLKHDNCTQRFYCYEHIIFEMEEKNIGIKEISYKENDSILDCDFISTHIEFDTDIHNHVVPWEDNYFRNFYWNRYNECNIVEKQHNVDNWRDAAEALADVFKPFYS